MRWGQWKELWFMKEWKPLSCYCYHSSFPVCFAITLITISASLALIFSFCLSFQPLIKIKYFMCLYDSLRIQCYLPLPNLKSVSTVSCFRFLIFLYCNFFFEDFPWFSAFLSQQKSLRSLIMEMLDNGSTYLQEELDPQIHTMSMLKISVVLKLYATRSPRSSIWFYLPVKNVQRIGEPWEAAKCDTGKHFWQFLY